MMSEIPSTIGRYEIEAVLGRGAMGLVYKGHDPEIDRPVAIKLVRADLLSGTAHDEYLARFRQEARAAGRCAHPNIVAIYDCALLDDNPYLTMEFVEGENLGEAFDRGVGYTPPEAIAIILQVLDALTYAHDLGIVHRDIKPANIIMLPSGIVKVADFGISRLPGSELTLAGSVMGTPSYMSPEQCRGEDVDHRSDLFSTGAVLFQLLTGEKPFPGRSVTEIIHRLLNEDPPDLQLKGVSVPVVASAALRRALAKRPADRFASAWEMAEELRQGFGIKEFDDSTIVASDPHGLFGFDDEVVVTAEAATLPEQEPPAAEASAIRTIARFDPAILAAIERNLARHVGPIARVLVRDAAGTAGNVAELCDRLAAHIKEQPARADFLAQARRQAVAATNKPDRLPAAEALTQRQPDPAVASAPAAKRLPHAAPAGGAAKTGRVGSDRHLVTSRRGSSAGRRSPRWARSLYGAGLGSVGLLLQVCRLATTAIAAVLLLGAFAALGYQATHWLQHNYWPDLRFVQLWRWVKIDPEPIGEVVGSRNLSWILQLPLWVGLMMPGIVVALISDKCGRFLRRTVASR